MRRIATFSLFTLTLALVACGRERDTSTMEEWSPADHQPPEGEQGDRTGAPDDVAATPEETEARAATALFGSMCAQCHGELGAGDGPGRPPVAQVPDFRSEEFQASRTDEQLATSISEGRGGFMPAFGTRLSPAGVAALVRHVRRLGGALAPAAPPADPATAPEPAPPAVP